MKPFPLTRFTALILFSALSNGCSTVSWYSQSIWGHIEIMNSQQPIDELLEQNDIYPALRTQLVKVQQIRQYATSSLRLPNNNSYTEYADIGRPYVVWNIVATPALSLKPETWCYPIVGCASYRGYYKLESAQKHKAELVAQGLDVYIGRVPAYSTLGWFDDPVLNTFIYWNDYQLAGLIFHELSHQILYIKDDTAFNESFARAVQEIGIQQWLKEVGPEQIPQWQAHRNARSIVTQFKADIQQQLRELYQSSLTDADKLKQKNLIFSGILPAFDELATRHPEIKPWRNWFVEANSNAWFTASYSYEQYLPAFLQLYIENNNNWPAFYAAVKKLARLEKADRSTALQKIGEKYRANSVSSDTQ